MSGSVCAAFLTSEASKQTAAMWFVFRGLHKMGSVRVGQFSSSYIYLLFLLIFLSVLHI